MRNCGCQKYIKIVLSYWKFDVFLSAQFNAMFTAIPPPKKNSPAEFISKIKLCMYKYKQRLSPLKMKKWHSLSQLEKIKNNRSSVCLLFLRLKGFRIGKRLRASTPHPLYFKKNKIGKISFKCKFFM